VIKINICVCTYQRPKLLLNCLESLAPLVVPLNTKVTVTVIDNDDARSAEIIVSALKSKFPFDLRYYCEERRGIPCARNRAIAETHRLGSDYLVFIDDDEWVESSWLKALYGYCQSQGGEIIVSGPVISELPDNIPEHIGRLFNKRQRETGVTLSSCGTGNVLVPIYVTKTLGLRFDETNPFSGGEDTRFFCQAVNVGVVIKNCAEAVVHEVIPVNRTTLKWFAKRKYSAGTTVAWRKIQDGDSKLGIVFSSIFRIIIEIVNCGFMILVGHKLRRNKSWLRVCRSFGILAGVLGVTVDMYRSVDS